MITLYGAKGSGSTVVEAALSWLDVKYRMIEIEPWDPKADLATLEKVSPLKQVPALELDDGTTMTETIAILLHLIETHPKSRLAPPAGTPERARFLRWLAFFPAAIYPMYTVGDAPEKWVDGEAATKKLRETTNARIVACWGILERELAPKKFLLGSELTIVDAYAAMMSRWRPGRDAIREAAPKVVAACERAEKEPALARVFAQNFPTS